MANARLHIICGNCRCNHMFNYTIVVNYDDDTEGEFETVSINCNNCGTIHQLYDNAEQIIN